MFAISPPVLMEPMERRLLLATARFAVIGDYSAGEPLADVSNLIKSWDADFITTVGDNNYPDGAAATIDGNVGRYFHEFISPYRGRHGRGSDDGNRFWPALGNHDYDTPGARPYLDYFELPGNERYYNVRVENVELFILNSNGQEPDGNSDDSEQAQWLHSELTTSSAKWKLVFFHHAAYSSGQHGSSGYMRWPFQEWGATAVLSGHDHTYERIFSDGLTYFVNGVGGAERTSFSRGPISGSQARYDDDYGAMRIDTSERAIVFSFITRGGVRIDSHTINIATTAVSGAVFNDRDGDGVRDGNEPGIAGRTVFLDADRDGVRDADERRTTTDSAGVYIFTAVPPGSHRVREIVPSGWRATGPVRRFHDVELGLGEQARRLNFGTVAVGAFAPLGLIPAKLVVSDEWRDAINADKNELLELNGRRPAG